MCNVDVLSIVHDFNCDGLGNRHRLPLLFCTKFRGGYGYVTFLHLIFKRNRLRYLALYNKLIF